VLAVTGAFFGALYGCPGSLEDPDRFRAPIVSCDLDGGSGSCDSGTSTSMPMLVTTAQIQASIITPKCAFPGCHGAMATQGMLDMSGAPGDVETRIVDVRSMTALCRNRTMVKPGDPDNSLMYLKLTTSATLCGDRMPQGGELTPAEKTMMRQWIIDLGVP